MIIQKGDTLYVFNDKGEVFHGFVKHAARSPILAMRPNQEYWVHLQITPADDYRLEIAKDKTNMVYGVEIIDE